MTPAMTIIIPPFDNDGHDTGKHDDDDGGIETDDDDNIWIIHRYRFCVYIL